MVIPKRAAGVLAPMFSLPAPHGIGTFGESAYSFVDFLKSAGQSYWQVLPQNPLSYGDSPYAGPSVFAGNPYFIDLDLLVKEGLLKKEDVKEYETASACVDYAELYRTRPVILKKAYANFFGHNAFETFKKQNEAWLSDYGLFCALKEEKPSALWTTWPAKIKRRDEKTLTELKERYRNEINYHAFTQFFFYKQWNALKKYANQNGVRIIGDIPIYTAFDSADVWASPVLFELCKDLKPVRVAGCPPDAFAADGQKWGNPLYNWEAHKKTGYKWWIERLGHNLDMFDVVRIDHFRGFESYYAIPAEDKTARNGVWEKGPCEHFIWTVNGWFNFPPIIAEDLGFLTKSVHGLLKFSGYPGMRVLQFGFCGKAGKSEHLPHHYAENCVAYTGTHDNDTAQGYYASAAAKEKSAARAYLGIETEPNAAHGFIRAVLNSVANLAVIPLADYLALGSEARINIPSTLGGSNWRWRVSELELNESLAKKMRRMTELSGRG
ncbi:MAG: 4-alpha-glucanotransferase [Firmicutes bacterium]|nr:4-alpha-glucanotransferase [Bacillota bacterium]